MGKGEKSMIKLFHLLNSPREASYRDRSCPGERVEQEERMGMLVVAPVSYDKERQREEHSCGISEMTCVAKEFQLVF